MNNSDLIRIHHADYQEDIPFWLAWTEDKENILELGCGHGRVTLQLLTAGRDVVGIDIDSVALDSLRVELEKMDREIQERAQIIYEDFFNYESDDQFGAVIIPCNTYSTFAHQERKTILSKAYKVLTPGGVFAASMPNPRQMRSLYNELRESPELAETDLETSFAHPETGYPVQVSSSLIAKENSLGWDWIYDHLQPDGHVDRFVQSTEHHFATLEMYREELSGAGFVGIQALGDFDSSEYLEDSPYLIFVAKKPAL